MLVGRELNAKAVEATRPGRRPSPDRAGSTGSALLIVNGISGSFCDQLPSETYAVAWLRDGSLSSPLTDPAFRLLLGQSDSGPAPVRPSASR